MSKYRGGPTEQVPLHVYERAQTIHRRVSKVGKILGRILTSIILLGAGGTLLWVGSTLWVSGFAPLVLAVAVAAVVITAVCWYDSKVLYVLNRGEENGVVDE